MSPGGLSLLSTTFFWGGGVEVLFLFFYIFKNVFLYIVCLIMQPSLFFVLFLSNSDFSLP